MKYDLLTGKRIRLVRPVEDDINTMLRWYDDMEFMRNLDTDVAYPEGGKGIEKMIASGFGGKDVWFHIRKIETGELIGFVALDGIQWNNGNCMLSIGIGEKKNRSRGYGKEAMHLMLDYAFRELNLHRVGLNFIDYNGLAENMYISCGFVREGVIREFVHRDNEYYDLIYMGILRGDWEKFAAVP